MRIFFALVCLLAAPAFAQTYHAGSSGKCGELQAHVPSADLEAKDGTDQHGNAVSPATMESSNMAHKFDDTRIYLGVPVEDYLDKDKYNANLKESLVDVGDVSVSRDGTTKLNGETITPQSMYSTECQ